MKSWYLYENHGTKNQTKTNIACFPYLRITLYIYGCMHGEHESIRGAMIAEKNIKGEKDFSR